MRVPSSVAVLCLSLTAWTVPSEAQGTGDQARLVINASLAYTSGRGLWGVPDQTVNRFPATATYALNRSIKDALGAGFAVTYYPKANLGLTGDAFLLGLGYEDDCRVVSGGGTELNEVCQSIDRGDRSAAAVIVSAGGIFRVASREFISPYIRGTAGLLFSNQSPLLTEGFFNGPLGRTVLLVYDDDKQSRVGPAFQIGVGTTVAFGKAYHLRWEVRDNIVAIQRVTGASQAGEIPSHARGYKHLVSLLVGLDVILERQRGRRY